MRRVRKCWVRELNCTTADITKPDWFGGLGLQKVLVRVSTSFRRLGGQTILLGEIVELCDFLLLRRDRWGDGGRIFGCRFGDTQRLPSKRFDRGGCRRWWGTVDCFLGRCCLPWWLSWWCWGPSRGPVAGQWTLTRVSSLPSETLESLRTADFSSLSKMAWKPQQLVGRCSLVALSTVLVSLLSPQKLPLRGVRWSSLWVGSAWSILMGFDYWEGFGRRDLSCRFCWSGCWGWGSGGCCCCGVGVVGLMFERK